VRPMSDRARLLGEPVYRVIGTKPPKHKSSWHKDFTNVDDALHAWDDDYSSTSVWLVYGGHRMAIIYRRRCTVFGEIYIIGSHLQERFGLG